MVNNTRGGTVAKVVMITVLMVSITSYIYQSFVSDLVPVTSSVDGREYLVQNLPDKHIAADQLATMCDQLSKFISVLRNEYPKDKRIDNLENRFKCGSIMEGDGKFGYTSYTTDKGDQMVLCIRDRNKKIHQNNLLMFVAIHEMAHVASDTYGHNDEFIENFKFLIEEAEARGVYVHQDFSSNPESYCGIMITGTPH